MSIYYKICTLYRRPKEPQFEDDNIGNHSGPPADLDNIGTHSGPPADLYNIGTHSGPPADLYRYRNS